MDSLLYTNYSGVPLLTYGLIGITSAVLAYVTITDTGTKDTTTEVEPQLTATVPIQDVEKSLALEEGIGEAEEEGSQQVKTGGRSKQRRKKKKQTKRKNRK